MQYRQLGKTGLQVSVLSYGASPLGSVFRKITDESEATRTVHTALDLGINFIDVSPYYGLTKAETVLGKALREIQRDRYYLATKVGRYGSEMKDFDFSAARATRSVDESLDRLGVSHVDIIQCHDIEFADLSQIVNETIPALRKIVSAGKARFVGITGLPLKVFQQVLQKTEVDTILSYCHYSLNDSALEEMLPFLSDKHVGIINASSLSMGLLSDRPPPDWHPASKKIRTACQRAAKFCQALGVPIAKIAVQFAVSNPQIATTLVGTASPRNIADNIKWASEPVDHTILHGALNLLRPIHNQTWPSGREENN